MQLLWKWAAHSLKICASNQFWQDEILKGGLQYVLLCDNHLKSWLVTRVPDFIFVQTLWYGGQRGWKWREIWIFLWRVIALYLKPLSKLNEKYFFFMHLFSIIHKIICSKWSGPLLNYYAVLQSSLQTKWKIRKNISFQHSNITVNISNRLLM